MTTMIKKKFLSTSEFANACGVSTATVQRWEREGILPAHHKTPGGKRMYDESQIDRYYAGEYTYPEKTEKDAIPTD